MMKNLLTKIKTYIIAHKIISIIILIIIIFVGNLIYGKITSTTGETRYILSAVTKGSIISSVTGSGQVSASSQIDIKPKVSGTITYLNINPGDAVMAGKLLLSIDNTDAQKTVRDAEIGLQTANLSLQKLQIQNSNENVDATLTKAYSDGFNTVSSTFLDLPSTITGLENLLNQQNLSENAARNSGNSAQDYRNTAENAFYAVQDAYNKNKITFNTSNYSSKPNNLDTLISETYNTTKLLAEAIKSLNDFVNYLAQDTGRPSDFTSYQTTLSGYTNTTSGHITSLFSAQTSIKSYKDSIPNNSIDLQSAQISVTQKENTLADAKKTLSDYYIRAPFDGVIASMPLLKGDTVNSGTIVATIISTQQIATIPLNEVEISQVQLGQKVTLTFDAVLNLTITGKVSQIDSIGTVSQGVVNYNVKITFDTNDPRIKPGMTANAAIITNIVQDVLMVPNSAIKSSNGASYVEIFTTPLPDPVAGVQGSPSTTLPIQQDVTVGISNDTSTEIISGLKEGDKIVTKTITGTTTKTTAPSILNAASGGRGKARIP